MAFLIKNKVQSAQASSLGGFGVIDQWIHVARPALVLPQTTTQQLFRVRGGRVLVHALLGEVTTVLTSTDPVVKISSKALDNASTAIGTAVDVASTVTLASLEAGGKVFIEGDGTAIVKSNAGAAFIGTNTGLWIAPQGEIYLTTGGNNVTGAMKWDIWYQPLDEGAYVEAIGVAVAAI